MLHPKHSNCIKRYITLIQNEQPGDTMGGVTAPGFPVCSCLCSVKVLPVDFLPVGGFSTLNCPKL